MITKDDVKYIASLARIHLQEHELEQLTHNLEDILHYVAKLQKLDVTNVEPTTHVLALKNVYREDVVKPSLTQKEALSISVAQHNGSFKVPQVIE
jgi:aspartyl-tRNA(Asn)/glutamyl-tRNA(Gln) amidotransferase subunit C